MVWQVPPEETLGRHSGAVPVTCSKSLGPPQPLGYMSACVTGKPANKNGLEGREEATGRGVQYILREFFRNDELLKLIKFTSSMQDKTFIIQGLGNVGFHAAKFISEDNKMNLIGIAEYNGGIFAPPTPRPTAPPRPWIFTAATMAPRVAHPVGMT